MATWRNDFLSINEALLGWVCLSVVWISKPVKFTNCIEEELAMQLSAFFYCFCFCLCRCCSFNPPSCCLLPYILICLTLSFQSHVVCWNFTLTGLHQCGHYGHLFLMYMLLSDSTKFRQLVYFTHLLHYQHWLLCNTIKMTFHCLCNIVTIDLPYLLK